MHYIRSGHHLPPPLLLDSILPKAFLTSDRVHVVSDTTPKHALSLLQVCTMLCSRLSRVAVRAMPRPAPRYRVGGGGARLGCGIGNAPAARPLPRFLSSAAKVGRSSSARGYEEDMWAKENERKALADERWEKKEAAKREAMGGLSPEEEAAYQKDRARRATNRRRYWAARM